MLKNQQTIQAEIDRIKRELLTIGSMRPGSLSRQPRTRGSEYYQLSYSHRGKGHTEYVRPEYEPIIRKEIEAYRKFRELTRRWVELALELAKQKVEAKGEGPRELA